MTAPIDPTMLAVATIEEGNAISLEAVATDLERAGIEATSTRRIAERSRLTAEQIRRGEEPH